MAPPKSGNVKRGTMHGASALGLVKFTIRAAPLPKEIWEFLSDNLALLRRMQQERKSREEGKIADSDIPFDGDGTDDDAEEVDLQGEIIKRPTVKLEDFWKVLEDLCLKVGGEWADLAHRLWAFGPNRAGTCALIDSRSTSNSNSLKRRLERGAEKEPEHNGREFDNHIEAGFQLATFQGPLCAEPMEGLAYFVENVEIDHAGLQTEQGMRFLWYFSVLR